VKREHLLHTLRSQGRFCAGSGSPMYGELFELVATDVEAGGVFASVLSGHEDDPSRHAVPLRLLGGLHRLVLDGRAAGLRRWYPSTGGTWDAGSAWPEILDTAENHSGSLRAALGQPPQTNEVGRSAALIGGLLRVNREFGYPVKLFEIGTSAGLNLRADLYHYRFSDSQWGPADSPVIIDDAWQGVTDVVRGEDLFHATSVHRLLQHLLGLPEPIYRHHRLIRDGGGLKLSKSGQATGLRELRATGATPADIRRQVALR